MVRGILKREKRYVSVESLTDAEGRVTPLAVVWEDGARYAVDAVLDCRAAASLKVGRRGLRYTVRVGPEVTYLFFEGPRWFVEAKVRGEFVGREGFLRGSG